MWFVFARLARWEAVGDVVWNLDILGMFAVEDFCSIQFYVIRCSFTVCHHVEREGYLVGDSMPPAGSTDAIPRDSVGSCVVWQG